MLLEAMHWGGAIASQDIYETVRDGKQYTIMNIRQRAYAIVYT